MLDKIRAALAAVSAEELQDAARAGFVWPLPVLSVPFAHDKSRLCWVRALGGYGPDLAHIPEMCLAPAECLARLDSLRRVVDWEKAPTCRATNSRGSQCGYPPMWVDCYLIGDAPRDVFVWGYHDYCRYHTEHAKTR